MPKALSYIFFEPENDVFFNSIANDFSKKYVMFCLRSLEDLLNRNINFKNNDDKIQFIIEDDDNIINKFIFPACNYNRQLGCNQSHCPETRRAVLTSPRQIEMLAKNMN
jgi:hypothetical protein